MKKIFLLAIAVLTAAGCFASHANRYFELMSPTGLGSGERAFDRALLVVRPEIAELYDDFRIVYRLSPTEINYYAYNFWAEKPSKMIWNMIQKRLGASGRFRRVDTEPGLEPTDWTLRIRVFRIEEIDESERWSGRLAMAFEVVDSATGQAIATHSFDRTEPFGQKDAALLAGALSKILAEEFDALLQILSAKK